MINKNFSNHIIIFFFSKLQWRQLLSLHPCDKSIFNLEYNVRQFKPINVEGVSFTRWSNASNLTDNVVSQKATSHFSSIIKALVISCILTTTKSIKRYNNYYIILINIIHHIFLTLIEASVK